MRVKRKGIYRRLYEFIKPEVNLMKGPRQMTPGFAWHFLTASEAMVARN
jgi:hypothetical protein